MTLLRKTLLGAAMGAGVLGCTTFNASAAIVCSDEYCWHSHAVYEYPPDSGVVVHPDMWEWGPNEHYAFREHEGRGYWRGDEWIEW